MHVKLLSAMLKQGLRHLNVMLFKPFLDKSPLSLLSITGKYVGKNMLPSTEVGFMKEYGI